MRITANSIVFITLSLAISVPVMSQDLSAIRKALEDKYTLTTTTADKTDIVKPGDVLVLKKTGLMTVDIKSRNVYQNKYVNGRITQNALGKSEIWLKKFNPSANGGYDRTFAKGEKVWITNIDVRESGVMFTLFTDAYSDTRYEADLYFPFEKYETPTVAKATALIAEVFDVQPVEDGKQQAPSVPPTPATQRGFARSAEATPPPLIPPPPPPAEPKTLELGQTPTQVTAVFGAPEKIIKLSTKQIYVYKDMKVTFVGGKVTYVE